jgi:hypothetical protein
MASIAFRIVLQFSVPMDASIHLLLLLKSPSPTSTLGFYKPPATEERLIPELFKS